MDVSRFAEFDRQLNEKLADNGCKRQDITFFATMSDGDYVEEMLDASVKMFNTH